LVMRSIFGTGTPRGLAERLRDLRRSLDALLRRLVANPTLLTPPIGIALELDLLQHVLVIRACPIADRAGFSTGC
jgi:hypothetical protein